MMQTLTLPSQFTVIHLRPPSKSVSPTTMRPPINAVHVATKAATLYDVLRVERTATIPEIKKAFRNLAKVYHPDVGFERNGCGDGEFIAIRNAYVTLSDPIAREVYDTKARRRAAVSGERRGFYSSRRWETDQCW